jgi:lactoylglutathione lyase
MLDRQAVLFASLTPEQLQSNSRHSVVAGAGHEIHLFEPAAVIQGVTDVLQAIRDKAKLPLDDVLTCRAGQSTTAARTEEVMELGAFSISLAVKDLQASRQFYEKLGFAAFAGDPTRNWLIMKNGDGVIGLFQGMFDKNILTFNPGWDSNAQTLASFTDVRELQRRLRAQGVQFVSEADESTTGPASFVVVDPDGNPILVDQHV